MVADMVEFSRRMEQDEVGNADQVTRSIQLFRNLIGDYGGRVANITGDGILALFDSAARRCASPSRSRPNFASNRFGATASRSSFGSASTSAR
jgi:class 3 adenylate cyclase